MKAIKIALFAVILLVSCSQPSVKKRKVYGYDFVLFSQSALREMAAAVQSEDASKVIHLSHKVDVNYIEPKYGQTLLMLAAHHGLNKSKEALLKCGANTEIVCKDDGQRPLTLASSANDYKCNAKGVRLLLDHGADPNARRSFHSSRGENIEETPLMIAATANCLAVMKVLLSKGADPEIYPYSELPGYGVITVSIIHKHLSITRFLIIDQGIEVPPFVYYRRTRDGTLSGLTVEDMLLEKDYRKGSENEKYKTEILQFLQAAKKVR